MSEADNKRRTFLKQSSTLLGGITIANTLPAQAWSIAPSIISSESMRPKLTQGLQMGDVTSCKGLIWSRCDRPARMLVEYSYDETFRRSRTVHGPYALAHNDFTTRLDLTDLRADSHVFVRVAFEDLNNERIVSDTVEGHFLTAPENNSRDIHFLWSGDTAGQGWGINPEFGGMRIYESMRQEQPDFFIHSGDTIYADGPIEEYANAENGAIWHNIVTEEVAKVAETLNEFRGRYRYNLLDHNVRAFNSEVPQIWQWDDHEVVNNWSASKDLSDDERYTEKNVPLLIARGTTAFKEYAPMRPHNASEQDRVYRHIPYGTLLDLLVLDMRSYRGPNSANDQLSSNNDSALLGERQLNWLKHRLRKSRSVWKVIASDMPIGLIVRDGTDKFENMANGDGIAKGRELEMVELLSFIKRERIENVVWLTADVHYCAAHYYNPNNAVFQDFEPFWEFVAGPLNAGSFGPGELDNTFGPEVAFHMPPPHANASPLAGFQFYGDVHIDHYDAAFTISLKDIDGHTVYSQELQPKIDQPKNKGKGKKKNLKG